VPWPMTTTTWGTLGLWVAIVAPCTHHTGEGRICLLYLITIQAVVRVEEVEGEASP
jgi:hypothetical protein